MGRTAGVIAVVNEAKTKHNANAEPISFYIAGMKMATRIVLAVGEMIK